jgi:hypothetical protein
VTQSRRVVRDEPPHRGVLDGALEHDGGSGRVHRHHHGTGLEDAEVRGDEGRGVVAHETDAVSREDSSGPHARRDGTCRGVELGEAQPLAAVHQRLSGPFLRGTLLEPRERRARALQSRSCR